MTDTQYLVKRREFVVMHEQSAGNAEVGEMWIETGVFPETATLAEVALWLGGKPPEGGERRQFPGGRVMLQIAQRPADD